MVFVTFVEEGELEETVPVCAVEPLAPCGATVCVTARGDVTACVEEAPPRPLSALAVPIHVQVTPASTSIGGSAAAGPPLDTEHVF